MTYRKTYEARTLTWSALRRMRKFGIPDLAVAAGVPERTVRDYVNELVQMGYVVQETTYDPKGRREESALYGLLSDTGAHAPQLKQGEILDPNIDPTDMDKRTRLWTLICNLRQVDVTDLACHVDGQQNTGAISRYLKFLADHGYLRVQRRNPNGQAGGRIRYQLVRQTGPHAPLRRRDGTLFDPNLGPQERAKEARSHVA